jgi:hypothetical protein
MYAEAQRSRFFLRPKLLHVSKSIFSHLPSSRRSNPAEDSRTLRCLLRLSRIVHKAGTIPLLNLTPKLIFTNCAFQISPSIVEDAPGRKLVNDLLVARNSSAITVSGKAGEM